MTDSNKTWTKKRVVIIVVVAFAYGIWFNILDSLAYPCEKEWSDRTIDSEQKSTTNRPGDCVPIGKMLKVPGFGGIGNNLYQPWNIIGHLLPGLFMLLLKPRKIELFIAGVLISSAVMDSPLWGIAHLEYGSLWHDVTTVHLNGTTTRNCFVDTPYLYEWIVYYYNPIGSCQVWKDHWLWNGFPTAAVIFWSLIGRAVGGVTLIWWQNRQESQGKEFSLFNILLNILEKIKIKQKVRGKP